MARAGVVLFALIFRAVGTLRVMTIIAAIGVPLVLAYTIGIYWVFRGKVHLDSMSY